MPIDLTVPQRESANVTNPADALIAAVITLADDAVDYLIEWVGIDLRNSDELHPATGLFSSFAATAKTVVEEFDYFDLDYRSEVAELIDSSFRLQTSDQYTSRLHFFAERVVEDEVHGTERVHDYLERAAESYLGYTIVNPEKPVRFGRSMVSTMTNIDGLASPEAAAAQIRTAVIEPVNVLGVSMEVVGVPFMEQDGNLLRCAHVSAWMCHFAAVLRGTVARRPSAHFHRTGDAAQSVGRPYPSGGVTTPGLSAMLKASDLPPEVLDRHALLAPRELYWADRSELKAAIEATLVEDDDAEAVRVKKTEDLDRIWIRENLGATVCRYVNSGIPVILARDSLDHTQVIVGYLRSKDLNTHQVSDDDDSHSDVVSFIVSDDQKGPFVVVTLDEIVEEFMHESWAETQLVIPLPRSLWMTGEAAERIASLALRALAKGRKRLLSTWGMLEGDKSRVDEHEKALDVFLSGLASAGVDKYTVRTYATPGVDFKRSFAKRVRDRSLPDVELVRGSGVVQLPKYVWVVEILDRALRRHNQPAVVASLVLDSTHTVHNLQRITVDDQRPLFAHIPGQALAGVPAWWEVSVDFEEDEEELPVPANSSDLNDGDFWIETTFEPYASGRWSAETQRSFPNSVAGFAKLVS